MCHDCLVIFLLQETLKSNLDLCLYGYVATELRLVSALKQDLIFIIVLFHKRINICLADCLDCLCDLIDRICIYFPSELDLSLDLIALGNGYIAHVVCDTHNADVTALHDTDRGAHPGCDALLYLTIFPISYDDLALDAHSGHDMAVLTVAVCSLVLIHEVHVDRIIRDLLIELGVQMKKRLAVLLQSKNPGLRR